MSRKKEGGSEFLAEESLNNFKELEKEYRGSSNS
jgi:hypothetical protein